METQKARIAFRKIAIAIFVVTLSMAAIAAVWIKIKLHEVDQRTVEGLISIETSCRKGVPASDSYWLTTITIDDNKSIVEVDISNPDTFSPLENLPRQGTFRGKIEFTCKLKTGKLRLESKQIKSIWLNPEDYADWKYKQEDTLNALRQLSIETL